MRFEVSIKFQFFEAHLEIFSRNRPAVFDEGVFHGIVNFIELRHLTNLSPKAANFSAIIFER